MMQALPGDAAYRIAAGRYGYDMMDAAAAEVVRAELGLDRPIIAQLGSWLFSLAQFDLGSSLVNGNPIVEEVGHQLGYSLLLAGCALVVSLVIAIPVGVTAGLNPGGIIDRLSLGLSILLRLYLAVSCEMRWSMQWNPSGGTSRGLKGFRQR